MKKMLLAAIAALTMWNTEAVAQTPVYEYTVDTSKYEDGGTVSFYPGPNAHKLVENFTTYAVALSAWKKKNSDQYDIFSFTGIIGSVTIPHSSYSRVSILLSQTFIDEDTDWECIVNYSDYPEDFYRFKVLDANGTTLLSDTGICSYGYDWQNTYVLQIKYPFRYKAWRFRTNLSSASPNGLAKTAGSMPHAMMTFGPTGDYRISLAPASGGKTSVRLMDMLGRCVFSKDFGSVTSPVSFTIPENGVPPSPFITKVQDEKGTVVRKEIPIR